MANKTLIASFLTLLIFLTLFISATKSEIIKGQIVVEPTYEFTISWAIQDDTIVFSCYVKLACWFGLGWHRLGSNDSGMVNADIVLVVFDDSYQGVVYDMWSQTNAAPKEDATSDLINSTAIQGEDFSAFQFARKLVTSDKETDNPISINETMSFIWAHGNTINPNLYGYHGRSAVNRGSVFIDLSSTNSTLNEPFFSRWLETAQKNEDAKKWM